MLDALDKGFQDGIEKGIIEGKAEGIIEGERKKALETAENLKSMGLSLEQIATATGLTVDDLTR
ncbi:MAG: hypothetical protein NEHIOOID_00919 [Holosporales bacterium]